MLANNKTTPLLLTLAVASAMVGATLWQGYQFWQAEKRASLPKQSQSSVIQTTLANKVPHVDLASLAMFGSPSSHDTAADSNTENLPETNLRLSLRGVLAAEGEFPGSALIEDDKGKTEAYLVGRELPGNATLRTVFPNRVIIERQGKLENLYFPETEETTGILMADNDDREPAVQPQAAQRTPGTQSTGEQQRREEIRQRLEQLRERLRNNN
ncbi:type II secretion system protein N [Marinobacter sp.]|uniref:type II secretion system protein N n=1 Tax=Marinobacter sp. TaxID=50741 RepID=UPI00356AAA7C